jgi:hypothetical protein
MKKKYAVLFAEGILLLTCVCFQGVTQKERLAYVGSTLITRQDFNAFSDVSRYFPNPPEEFFLGARSPIGAIVETEAMYHKTRWDFANIKYRHSLEWKWRERYYLATLYMERIIQGNFGFSDKELKKYFKSHRQYFTNTIKSDSGGKACSTKVVLPFEESKQRIAEKMLLAAYPPDSEFKHSRPTLDTGMIINEWLRYLRDRGVRDLYFKKYFKEEYARAYPDSLKDIYGKGKIVSPEDMNVILSWIPVNRREQLKNNPQGLKDLAGWLVRWKLFSEKAISTGYASQPDIQATLKWAWRFETAQRYINEKVVPAAKKDVHIDTAMTLYSYWDETETPGSAIDTANWKNALSKQRSLQVSGKFDSLVYEIRRSEGVRFLTDWKDDRAKDPAKLLRQADSLRDTGNTSDAQSSYQILIDNFSFTKEGSKALIEVAKIKTEQQMYREAIANYRRFLVIDADRSKQCNYMFMIGFIYDEYCNKPEMAEANYKWVLKNAPGCELADDAEFMMLHLGEQMASVDELQAEVKRQGKKVEASETDTAGLKVEMMPVKQNKK